MNQPVGNNATGKTVRALRSQRRLSQRALGAIAGLSHATIGQIERGETPDPGRDTLARLARALGVNPAALFDEVLPGVERKRGPLALLEHADGNAAVTFNEAPPYYTMVQPPAIPDNEPLTDWVVDLVRLVSQGMKPDDADFVEREHFAVAVPRNGHHYTALRVRATSMVPFVVPGDIVVIDHNAPLEEDSIAVFQMGEMSVLRWATKNGGGKWLFAPEDLEGARSFRADEARYIGVVSAIQKPKPKRLKPTT